jgi:hypothetical protein
MIDFVIANIVVFVDLDCRCESGEALEGRAKARQRMAIAEGQCLVRQKKALVVTSVTTRAKRVIE